MIVNRRDRLIFIKTKKTAGTSFEIALSKGCGADCIITPITPSDERLRRSLGFRGAQNFKDYFWREEKLLTRGTFFNHMPAALIKRAVPRSVWEGYLKLTIVRNPFDVAISRYYWEGGERQGLSFLEYLRRFPEHLRENAVIAPASGDAVPDLYLRYERLEEDLRAAGLAHVWEVFSTIRAKGDRRPKSGASMADVYGAFPEAAQIVEKTCAEAIRRFNYSCA